MKNFWIILIALFLIPTVDYAQSNNKTKTTTKNSDSGDNVWKTLGKVTFKKEYDEFMGFKVDVPVFAPEVKALDGKEITLRGYIIPVEGYKSHKSFVFSAYPYNMCYFCGGAGPETVMEVSAVEGIEYTADPITIKGILQLNSGDVNQLIYSLSEAKFVSN